MSKANVCGACGQARSAYVMNNKSVCLKCDELLFDLEIECEDSEVPQSIDRRGTTTPVLRKVTTPVVKKG